MPKLAKLLETFKVFLFEHLMKYLVTIKSKQKNKKGLTFQFFFSVAHFGLVEPKSGISGYFVFPSWQAARVMPSGEESKKGDSRVKWVPESYDISISVQRLSCTVSNLLKDS